MLRNANANGTRPDNTMSRWRPGLAVWQRQALDKRMLHGFSRCPSVARVKLEHTVEKINKTFSESILLIVGSRRSQRVVDDNIAQFLFLEEALPFGELDVVFVLILFDSFEAVQLDIGGAVCRGVVEKLVGLLTATEKSVWNVAEHFDDTTDHVEFVLAWKEGDAAKKLTRNATEAPHIDLGVVVVTA